jgi:ribosomal protein S18 acetylase RimI-like enzyme
VGGESPFVHLQIALPRIGAGRTWPLPAGIALRTAQAPRDLAPIAELYNAAFGRDGDDAVTPQRVARFAYHPGLSPLGVFLAYAGDQAVGLGVARLAVPAPGQADHTGAVELLAVRPGFRRRGLAHALLDAILSWLAQQGVTLVEASTDRPAVIGLLMAHGFMETAAPAAGNAG